MELRRTGPIFVLLLVAVLLVAIAIGGCAKSTGDDDDDDDNDDTGESDRLTDAVVHLNMVPVRLGDTATPQARTFYVIGEPEFDAESILVSEFVDGIPAFADDADRYHYWVLATTGHREIGRRHEFLDRHAFFVDEASGDLCIGSLQTQSDHAPVCDLNGGWILADFPPAPLDPDSLLDVVNERDVDGHPVHAGEAVEVWGKVTLESDTAVSGSYLKTFLQDGDDGVKVFADWSATQQAHGYDGSLFETVHTLETQKIIVLGTVTVHEQMIELVPKSAYHVMIHENRTSIPRPVSATIPELLDSPTAYAGRLVRVDDLVFADIDEGDPSTRWPAVGAKSKNLRVRHQAGGPKIGLPIYERTGIPGSIAPEDGFDIVGVVEIAGSDVLVFPRKIEDINPTDETVDADIEVGLDGEETDSPLLKYLPTGLQVLTPGSDPVPVLSLASVIRSGLRDWFPRRFSYKPVAYDGRAPFETLSYDAMKSGVLYQTEPTEPGQPDPMGSSRFWDGIDLSPTFTLDGVTQIVGHREDDDR